ncbi:MAG: redoxin domain-containing protein [Thermotogota bacterium]
MSNELKRLPYFNLKDENENDFDFYNIRGKYTILYFFPKAFTSGCTKETDNFAEKKDLFLNFEKEIPKKEVFGSSEIKEDLKTEIQIIGVSPDNPEKLKKFIESEKAFFHMISDPDKEFAESLGAIKDNGGIKRSTFIIDRWGRIRKSFYNVKVDGHVEKVIEILKEIIEEDQEIDRDLYHRRSFRSFSPEKVSKLELEQLIKTAHLSPSCFNNQPWRYHIIEDEKKLKEFHKAIPDGNYWVKYAPAVIVVYGKVDDDCDLSDNRQYLLFDIGLSIGLILKQATKMGILTHPIAGFSPKKVKKILEIDDENIVVTVIPVGYPGNIDYLNENHTKSEKSERERKDISEILKWN